MRLSELMSSLGLWVYPVVGLLGFFSAFLVVLVRVSRTSRDTLARQGALPLDDGEPAARTSEDQTASTPSSMTEDQR
jgi:hypothetical protein